MDNDLSIFIKLMNCSTKDKNPLSEIESLCLINANWENIYRFAMLGKVLPLICEKACIVMRYVNENSQMQKEDLTRCIKRWEKTSLFIGCNQIMCNHELERLLIIFNKRNISPVLFKGIILGNMYDEEWMRFSADADLLAREEYEDICKVLEEEGYVYDKLNSKKNVAVYEKDNLLKLEIHKRLWEDYTGKNILILEKFGVGTIKHMQTVKIGDVYARTLDAPQHLMYLLFHLIKHISFSGAVIRSVLDISLFIDKHGHQCDFPKTINAIEECGYKFFTSVIFSICHYEFDMDITYIPKDMIMGKSYSQNMLLRLYETGAFAGMTNQITSAAKSSVFQVIYCNRKSRWVKMKLWIVMIFPGRYNLGHTYDYARRYPVLLPVAWVHRVIKNVIHKGNLCKRVKRDVIAADKKVSLMQELKISGGDSKVV